MNRGQEFVIGGYFPGPHGIDSLIVGYYDGEKLMYVARARNGFVPASRRQVFSKLKHLVTPSCPVIRNLDSLVAEGNNRLQERSSLNQRKSCQITILPAQQSEDVVLNPRCLSAEILQEIEVRPAAIIDGDNFSIDDRSLRQIGQRLDDIRKLSVQRFSSPREQCDAGFRLDYKGPITVEFDLFCGVERYVALTLIGDLAKRTFAEKHHII